MVHGVDRDKISGQRFDRFFLALRRLVRGVPALADFKLGLLCKLTRARQANLWIAA